MSSLIEQIPVSAGTDLGLPARFARLYDLAYNLWWTWDHEGGALWSYLDPARWIESNSPLSLLLTADRWRWEKLGKDESFLSTYDRVISRFDTYMANTDTWYDRTHPGRLDPAVAYLSSEFGVQAKLPFYSGGLGVLAGDHAKAASDLGIPLVGIGLFYRRGYFAQEVDHDGDQQHSYTHVEITRRPVRQIVDSEARPLAIPVDLPGRTVHLAAWRVDVGRVPLILLDSDLPENEPEDRPITHILYVLGRDMRLAQEVALGVGARGVLDLLGIVPAVWHVNEGHAAFSLVDRLGCELAAGAPTETAREEVAAHTLFTLHTPVPAGNEIFATDRVVRYLAASVPEVDEATVRDLGSMAGTDTFNMGALAIRLSAATNGVSKQHAEVVSRDWGSLIGGRAAAITNGVHTPSWVGPEMVTLFERHVGADWPRRLTQPEAWKAIREADDDEVWDAHQAQKRRLGRYLRHRLREQFARHGAGPDDLRLVDLMLPEDRLTVAWARRFASYKRAGLFFRDMHRATQILTNPRQPMQLIFAGKAHPADREGQALIRWVVELSQSSELAGHVVFIENYDLDVARILTSGADVWLNTPRPPMEASGTSGMKAALNGVLNLSVRDGWWAEADGDATGWAVGATEPDDERDAASLYGLLGERVAPLYHERNQDDVPEGWVEMMKNSIAMLTPAFSSHRMVEEYVTTAYIPLAESG